MVSTLDIFGLAVGSFYAFIAPIAAYFLLRTFVSLRARDVALGVLGFIATVILNKTIVGPFAIALNGLIESKGYIPGGIFTSLFLFQFSYHGTFSLLAETLCFLLLKYFATRGEGFGPGIAYAIGAGGAYCLVIADAELDNLLRALATNEYGPGAAFGQGARVSQDFLAYAFAYGIPMGVGAVFRVSLGIVLASLVWRGILERRWKFVGAAVVLDVGLQAAFWFLSALSTTFALNIPLSGYDSLFGLVAALSYFWLPPVLQWRARLVQISKDRLVVEDDGSIRPGLLSTWRRQRWRGDQN